MKSSWQSAVWIILTFTCSIISMRKNVDPYMDEKYGIMDYLLAQKKAGRIRHLGFSAHGRYDTMEKFLKVYGKGDGVLPDPAQLSGLEAAGCQGEGGTARSIPDSGVGHGASPRRRSDKAL